MELVIIFQLGGNELPVSIRFRITSPMLFRKYGEFRPLIRGPQTIATSLPLPTPITILGAISSIIMDLGKSFQFKNTLEWYEEFINVLNLEEKDWFRGPYLCVENEEINEIYVPFYENIISLNSLYSIIDSKSILEGKLIEQEFEKYLKKPSIIERIGIGINREAKSVSEGLIYMVREVDYSEMIRKGKVYIAIDTSKELNEIDDKIVGLGGERRSVKVSISKPLLIENVEKMLYKQEKAKNAILYVVSHALFDTPTTKDDVINYLENKFRLSVDRIIGKLSVMGAGYSISKNVRKPIYCCLEPGSMILIRGADLSELIELTRIGISKIAPNLGLGTIIPILCDSL